MLEILSALWPVFALVLLGFLSQRIAFPSVGFWQEAEKATYFVLFPSLLVLKIATADLSSLNSGALVAAVLGLLALGSLVALAARRFVVEGDAAFTSVFQGGVRFNTYVGLAASAALFAEPSLPIAALVITLMIPTLNVACVLAFSWVINRGGGVKGLVRSLLKNPLIVACLLGFAINQIGYGLPFAVSSVLELISRMALPLGLLAVGAGIHFSSLSGHLSSALIASTIKLVIFPILMALLTLLLGIEGLEQQVLILFAALPTAPSAYILARQLGGDAPLMASIIAFQTLAAMVTLPFVLWLQGMVAG